MSSQNIRYTSFMSTSENDHSNIRIYTLSLPTGSLAVIKRGVYKRSLFIFHRELYSVLSDFSLTSGIKFEFHPRRRGGWGLAVGGGGGAVATNH